MNAPAEDTLTEQRGVLFADLANSSRLYRELGDARAREVLSAALALARTTVEAESGRVVDQIGDELFCLFPDGDSALRAALAIQERTENARETGHLPPEISFRIGFVHGQVGLRGLEVFGDSVYLAKRVANAAKAEQVLTSRETVQGLTRRHAESFLVVDRLRMKGRVEEIELVEALWGNSVTLPVSGASPLREIDTQNELRLRYLETEIAVSIDRPSATLGRSVTCDLVIDDTGVSRSHARVELEREGFLLVDQSRNGTLVQRAGRKRVTVRRASEALRDCGTLQLGSHEGAPVIEYAIRLREA